MLYFYCKLFFRAYSRTISFYVCGIHLTLEKKGVPRLITEAALALVHRSSPSLGGYLIFKKETVKYRTDATLDSILIMYTCVICIAMIIAA